MKYFIALISVCIFLCSCTTDLEIPIPEHEPKLTLYAFLTEDRPIDVYLSRSFGILEKITVEDVLVKDAKVEVFKNGQLVDEMVYIDTTIMDTVGIFTYSLGPGQGDTTFYSINTLEGARYFTRPDLEYPKAGDVYRFVVSHDTYGTVQAETLIPEKVDLRNVKVSVDSLKFQDFEGFETNWTAITPNMNDRAGIENFYNIMVGVEYEISQIFPDTTFVDTFRDWTWPGNEIIRDPDGYTYTENEAISDEGYDGQVFSPIFWASLDGYSTGGNIERENKRLIIKAFNMTKAYAQFKTKLRIQTYNRLDGIESAFVPSEPVVIPSNVEGGYGVVGAYNLAEDFVVELR